MELPAIFSNLLQRYTTDHALISAFWKEIEKRYTNRKRHYHHLTHLEKLIAVLAEYQPLVKDWDSMLLAVFYHDIVYSVLKTNNEEKSAALAAARLKSVGFPVQKIAYCSQLILATKAHTESADAGTNLFTDADLSILGQSPDTYQQYCVQIRKEYAIYPDVLYKPGRIKVIRHFLQMERIFKTEVFFNRFETRAKENLQWELHGLAAE
jgi:predicted metal-dependent HD superfamily phosphohydrolase